MAPIQANAETPKERMRTPILCLHLGIWGLLWALDEMWTYGVQFYPQTVRASQTSAFGCHQLHVT